MEPIKLNTNYLNIRRKAMGSNIRYGKLVMYTDADHDG